VILPGTANGLTSGTVSNVAFTESTRPFAQEKKVLFSLSVAKVEQSASVMSPLRCLAEPRRGPVRALEILNRVKTLSQEAYASPFDNAVIHVGVSELTSAFEQLEEAYWFRLVELTMPMFDSSRLDLRWKNLVRRIRVLLN
jgi:hypothetical protein